MEKYEVDDFYVNKYGYLFVKRLCESGYQTMDCPFTLTYIDGESSENSGFEGKACGKWCPLFGEVEEDAICQIKSISLCHKTIWCRIKRDKQKDS